MNYTACKIWLDCDLEKVNEWADYMRVHMDEVSCSLQQENVDHEMWFCGEDQEGLYLIGVMDCAELEKASKVAKHSELSVDIVHKEFKKFWGKREMLVIDPVIEPRFPEATCILDARPL